MSAEEGTSLKRARDSDSDCESGPATKRSRPEVSILKNDLFSLADMGLLKYRDPSELKDLLQRGGMCAAAAAYVTHCIDNTMELSKTVYRALKWRKGPLDMESWWRAVRFGPHTECPSAFSKFETFSLRVAAGT